MADPKYADLPGIAYDQVDVYETTDLPESDQFQIYSEDETDSIERLHISATEAFNKFKGKHLLGKGVDFSDRISRKPRTGYNAIFGEWELPGEGEKETPAQKYQRLRCEIKELFEEINQLKGKDDEEIKSAVEIVSQLEQTGKELDSLKLEQCLGSDLITALSDPQGTRLKQMISQIELFKNTGNLSSETQSNVDKAAKEEPTESGVLKYEMMYLPEKARLQEMTRIAHLEQRLARLENIIGVNNDNLARFSQVIKSEGVMEAVQQLGAKASLLDVNQLDAMENKLATLIHRMDSVAQKKAAIHQNYEREEKIIEMYEIMKKTEATSQILPQTVNRMLVLSGVHHRAAEFNKSLTQLEELQAQISGGLESNKTLLKGVQESFASNLEIIKNNITALDERIKKLNK